MSRRSQLLFLWVVIGQAMHSVEEYVTGLYEFFPPAKVVSGLVSDDPAVGFVIVNAVLVAVGVWCYLGPVRAAVRAGRIVAWIWTAIELANGIAHLAIAAWTGRYFSGAFTAVFLVAVTACLAFSLTADRRRHVPVA